MSVSSGMYADIEDRMPWTHYGLLLNSRIAQCITLPKWLFFWEFTDENPIKNPEALGS